MLLNPEVKYESETKPLQQLQAARLWSLLEMAELLRFMAGNYTALVANLERVSSLSAIVAAEGRDLFEDWQGQMHKVAKLLREESRYLPFSRSLKQQCIRFAEHLEQDPTPADKATMMLAREVTLNIQAEMAEWSFFAVPEGQREWYHGNDKPLFGQPVADAFPESSKDIAEAGRCLALARWTGCVFHLMRALESALHQWAEDLKAPLKIPVVQANWQEILNAAALRLKELGGSPRSQQRDLDLEYFGQTHAQFLAIKDAWRNHATHAKRSYDEREAREVLTHVRGFMERLAARPRGPVAI